MMWILIIYVLSVIGSYYANKIAYKKGFEDIIPVIWIVPCINIIFIIDMLRKICLNNLSISEYIKDKWDVKN